MFNKKIINLAILCLVFIFTGCTSKYQTNKLPSEEKMVVPKNIKEKKYYLNLDMKEDFRKYVINEFNNGIEKNEDKSSLQKSKIPKNLWNQGYELDKKRY